MGRCIAAAFVSLCVAGPLAAQTVVVYPKRIADVLVNPGIGITTFQRFNGDALNAGQKWSEEGPVKQLTKPASAPEFPPSTISYCRWFWETLEPEQGKIRWDIIDSALAEAHRHGQTLAIRLMPYDKGHPLPEWYRKSGAKRANAPTDPVWEPDFSDPLYRKHWGNVVLEAGRRYDGHPDLESVDISTIGYWGEGWSDFMPAFKSQSELIDLHFQAFPHTQLLMNFDEPEALTYGTLKGAGWRMDCLGDMRTSGFSHMRDFYPEQVARAGIQDVWRKRPVVFETCWVPSYWKDHGWDVRYILDEALRWHVSSVNVKSSAIPAEWKGIFDEFQTKMGYRLELRRLEYDRSVKRGDRFNVRMWWVNTGVAPLYRRYDVAVELRSGASSAVMRIPADVQAWVPGDYVVEERPILPDSIAAGKYRVRVALLDPKSGNPAIRLGIAGRQADGWYDLGDVDIAER